MIKKRGQVTFIIIFALVIVGILLVVFFVPQANILISGDVNPSNYLRECIEPEVETVLDTVTQQGGYLNPSPSVMYQGNEIQYLCYTNENYIPCVVQQPLLINYVENEINNFIQPRAEQCLRDLEQEYENRGYEVTVGDGEINTMIELGKVTVDFVVPMTVEKESVQTFNKFAVGINSEIYSLLIIATDIIRLESTVGDSETTVYLQNYPNLKIDKVKRNGDTIYKITDVVTNEEFTFASRSLVWPEGYT